MDVRWIALIKPPYGTITAINLDKGDSCGRSRTVRRRTSFAITRLLRA